MEPGKRVFVVSLGRRALPAPLRVTSAVQNFGSSMAAVDAPLSKRSASCCQEGSAQVILNYEGRWCSCCCCCFLQPSRITRFACRKKSQQLSPPQSHVSLISANLFKKVTLLHKREVRDAPHTSFGRVHLPLLAFPKSPICETIFVAFQSLLNS